VTEAQLFDILRRHDEVHARAGRGNRVTAIVLSPRAWEAHFSDVTSRAHASSLASLAEYLKAGAFSFYGPSDLVRVTRGASDAPEAVVKCGDEVIETITSDPLTLADEMIAFADEWQPRE
jgi:hypothetical protein